MPLPTELHMWQLDPRNSHYVSAYSICTQLEKKLQKESDSGKNTAKEMMFCRILGYLFHHAPTQEAIQTVTTEVVSARDDEALLKVGEMYYNLFIRAFKSNKGSTPMPSAHASGPSFDNLADMKKEMLRQAPQNHETAKKNALVRDGFQCVITNVYDCHTAMSNKELEQVVESSGVPPEPTHCAHIFPESTNANITSNQDKKYAAGVWAVLDRFGYKGVSQELNGSKIHRLENVITLAPAVHDIFDRLWIWFIATEEPNKYKLEAAREYLLYSRPKFVMFSSPDPETLPLPNPAYLRIHATCAKVAHLSGASEYIESTWKRLEEICVLAEDGGSSELLHEAILSSAMHLIEPRR